MCLIYQTGAPVSKNSDAIKKALDAIAADLGGDDDDDDDEEGDVAEVDISEVSLFPSSQTVTDI